VVGTVVGVLGVEGIDTDVWDDMGTCEVAAKLGLCAGCKDEGDGTPGDCVYAASETGDGAGGVVC
jgi:hypothetical protein